MDFDHEFSLNFTITTALLFVTIIFLIIKVKKSKAPAVIVNWPPGPKPLPIIGNIHQLSSLPFRSFRDLAKQYGPIMHLWLGQVPTIVVSSPEIAKEMLKEHDPSFADRPGSIALKILWYNYLDISFSPYGNYWRQMRKICIVELLSAKMVRAFASIRNDEVSRLVKSIHAAGDQAINLTVRISSMTSSITCRAAFGKVSKDNELLLELLEEGRQRAGGLDIADLYPTSKIVNALSWSKWKLVMMRRKLDVILDGIIDEHKVNLGKGKGNGEFGNEDLIDVLLRIKDGGELEFPIHYDNIKGVLFDMFSAGTDTSSTLIDWTMTELMRNPRVMAKAQAEVREVFKDDGKIIDESDVQKLKYLKNVIKEALRLHPPVPVLPRASRKECVINGYTIPSKVKVLVNNWAMQRDPKYWTNPESFEPERFEIDSKDFIGGDFEFLPFGTGRRMCPGMTFGLASVEYPMAKLLYNFNWKLPDGTKPEELDMIESPGITVSRKDNLLVVPTPYESLA